MLVCHMTQSVQTPRLLAKKFMCPRGVLVKKDSQQTIQESLPPYEHQ